MPSTLVLVRSGSDLSVFFRCAFYGYQDTLLVLSQRQFYRECDIFGTIDIIFGNAAAVFQNCIVYVRRPMTGQGNVVTAQGRDDPNQNTGIVIHNSRIMPAPDLRSTLHLVTTYLGGPWKRYSRTVMVRRRVKWPSYHIITSRSIASRFIVGRFIAGRPWLPTTGVPFTLGL